MKGGFGGWSKMADHMPKASFSINLAKIAYTMKDNLMANQRV
jgi:hypothetical protein